MLQLAKDLMLLLFGGRSVNSCCHGEDVRLSAMKSPQMSLSALRAPAGDLPGESLKLVQQPGNTHSPMGSARSSTCRARLLQPPQLRGRRSPAKILLDIFTAGDKACCGMERSLSGKHEAIAVAGIVNKPVHAGQDEITKQSFPSEEEAHHGSAHLHQLYYTQ